MDPDSTRRPALGKRGKARRGAGAIPCRPSYGPPRHGQGGLYPGVVWRCNSAVGLRESRSLDGSSTADRRAIAVRNPEIKRGRSSAAATVGNGDGRARDVAAEMAGTTGIQ